MADTTRVTEAELDLADAEGRLIIEPCPTCGTTPTGYSKVLGDLFTSCGHAITSYSLTVLPRTFQHVRDHACAQLASLISDLGGEWTPASGPGAPAEAETFARAHQMLVAARRELLGVRGVSDT